MSVRDDNIKRAEAFETDFCEVCTDIGIIAIAHLIAAQPNVPTNPYSAARLCAYLGRLRYMLEHNSRAFVYYALDHLEDDSEMADRLSMELGWIVEDEDSFEDFIPDIAEASGKEDFDTSEFYCSIDTQRFATANYYLALDICRMERTPHEQLEQYARNFGFTYEPVTVEQMVVAFDKIREENDERPEVIRLAEQVLQELLDKTRKDNEQK